MGSARDWLCTACGERARDVCEVGDCGMDMRVVTPVVCPQHGIVWGDTGTAWGAENVEPSAAYPCPLCGRVAPQWDHVTCPSCGSRSMVPDPEGGAMMWD